MKSVCSRLATGLGVVAILAVLVFCATPAAAGVGGSNVPTLPLTAQVGEVFEANTAIINQSTDPNNTENVTLTTLFITPSCADSTSNTCLSPNEDPGVFKVLSADGDGILNPCAGVSFTVGAPDPTTGEVALVPQTTVTLGPATGPLIDRTCRVNIQLRVFKVPTNPAPGPPTTTDFLTRAVLHGEASDLDGSASGSANITILRGEAVLATASTPNSDNVVPGTSVTDTVIVTHAPGAIAPTGNVRFILCQPSEVTPAVGCAPLTGSVVPPDKALAGNTATSDPTTDTTAIGKYCWRARYLGDTNYLPKNHTNDTTECFTTVQLPSTTTTVSNPTGGNVAPGTSVTDTATVSGQAGQPIPTGTVTFILCQPVTVTSNGGDCSSGGSQVGAAKTLNGSGQATSDAANNTTTVGKYCWRAEYSGDALYTPSSHTDSTNECFTIIQQSSSTATLSNPTGGNVAPGTSVTDTATVSGAAGQPTPTGTVTFFLCRPGRVTTNGGDCSSGGTQVGAAKTLNNGQATSDPSTNTTAIGKYCWRAEYSGDALYSASSHTDGTSECFTTVKQPSTTATLSSPTGGNVAPGTSVTDTATVSGPAGQPTPTGTVAFFLCQPATVTANGGDCSSGGAQVGGAKTLNNGQVTSDPSTNTTAIGKYCWRAQYSGDGIYDPSAHTDASSECFTVVGHPHLTLVKTPDNTIYNVGDTINFTIVVGNTGDATAHNVQLNPPDALPDPTVSLNWGPASPTVTCTGQSGSAPTCTVSGAIGSQVLTCNFGDIEPNGQCSVTVSSETPTAAACVPSPGLVNQATVVDNEGDSASDTASQSCNPAGCRITGGPNGGQVGAPCGCIGNFLEFDHVQGNWNYRTGGGRVKAANFNSLTCGCDVANDGNTAALSNGQVCGDRVTGPTPPRAPSNVACFSGTATLGNGAHAPLVAFRFEIRDHGEPGVLDENHVQVWIPTGQETAESIAQQIACTDSCSAFRPADIDEGLGVVANGNIQIHRDIAPHEGICPVPGVVCPVPPDGICPFDPED